MVGATVRTHQMGKRIYIILPEEAVKKENIKVGDTLHLTVKKVERRTKAQQR